MSMLLAVDNRYNVQISRTEITAGEQRSIASRGLDRNGASFINAHKQLANDPTHARRALIDYCRGDLERAVGV
jgi:hypothetical protein